MAETPNPATIPSGPKRAPTLVVNAVAPIVPEARPAATVLPINKAPAPAAIPPKADETIEITICFVFPFSASISDNDKSFPTY